MTQAATDTERVYFSPTQLGLARRFVENFGEDLRYSYARRRWLYWDGRRWAYDDGSHVELLMKRTIDMVLQRGG